MVGNIFKNNRRTIVLFVLIASIFITIILYVSQNLFQSHPGKGQEQMKARVITSETLSKTEDKFQTFLKQKLQVAITENGQEKIVAMEYDSDDLALKALTTGDEILVTKTQTESGTSYHFAGRYRVERILMIIAGFLLIVFLAAGKKGLGALAGLAVSTAVILFYIIPQIVKGADPLTVSLIGAMIIMFVSIYVAHGVSKQTTVALIATFVALVFTYVLSWGLIQYAFLSGFGTEDAYNVFQPEMHIVDIKALLVGGILIATLGALDDVTTAQAAAVFELAKANPKLSFLQLIQSGMTIGREHMVSLMNTLIIAYIGSSLMLFVTYFIFYRNEYFLSILNREPIAEAIVQTIAISTGLVLALPTVTVLAAYAAHKYR